MFLAENSPADSLLRSSDCASLLGVSSEDPSIEKFVHSPTVIIDEF